MRLRVQDADDIKEGTGLATICAPYDSVIAAGLGKARPGFRTAYIKVIADTETFGAVVEAIRTGPGLLEIDPLLRRRLNAQQGSSVEIEELCPCEAEEVRLAVSEGETSESELNRLWQTYVGMQPVSAGQMKPVFLYSGKRIDVEVLEVLPSDLCIVVPTTRIAVTVRKEVSALVSFANIGGLEREIQLLQERLVWPLRNREFFASMGIQIPRGIILGGPPGCGKTLLARALSHELDIACFTIRGPEVVSGVYGESEKRIRDLFAKAREKAPALILIDEIDSLAPSRESTRGELERRIVTCLLTEMDGLQEQKEVLVVATTNDVNALDQALRRPGRFDFELSIGAPDKAGRLAILKIHSRHMPLQDVSLEDVAEHSYGYSGADLMNLCREAAFNALKRVLGGQESSLANGETLSSTLVTTADFDDALKTLRPSALREFAVEVPPDLSWEDVGGVEKIKDTLVEEVVQAIASPESYTQMGIRPVKGVLLYGPPGTGKTLLARVIANRAGANIISVRGPEILSKWVGESEQRVRQLFERARQVSPCIVFFDEIDSLTAKRGSDTNEVGDRVVNQLLTEMDGFAGSKQVCVVAATNRKDLIDPALLRPGRFDYVFEVPLPGPKERKSIFGIHLRHKPLADDIDLDQLASEEKTRGFSGAHIEEVCRRAALEALRGCAFSKEAVLRGTCRVGHGHLLAAIETVRNNIENLEKKTRRIGFRSTTDEA